MNRPILSPCTLADLVSHEALGLRVIAGPTGFEDRPVTSAQIYSARVDEDRLGADELILFIGGWEDSPTESSRIAEVFAKAEVAAVVIPDTVDEPLRAKASDSLSAAGIPVFAVARTTRFADIIDTVSRAHASPDTARFQRMLSMQQSLVAAMESADPADRLVRKLATLTDGIAGVTDESGLVENATGVLPFVLFRQEIGGYEAPTIDLDTGGWKGLAVRLHSLPGRPRRWLILASRRDDFINAYGRAAAAVTASLLEASKRIDTLAMNQDRAMRSSILRRALELQPFESTEGLGERASALGLNFANEVRVLSIVFPAAHRPNRIPPVDVLEETIAAHGATAFTLEQVNGFTVMLQASPETQSKTIKAILSSQPGSFVGTGRAIEKIGEVATSHHDAILAVQFALRGRKKRVAGYDELDFSVRLLADIGRESMTAWRDRILGPFRDKPLLLEAITAYFADEFDVMSAARQLNIHHNSMRYRLSKVEEILGASIRSPSMITALHLAMTAEAAGEELTAETLGPLRPSHDTGDRVTDVVASEAPASGPTFQDPAESFGAARVD